MSLLAIATAALCAAVLLAHEPSTELGTNWPVHGGDDIQDCDPVDFEDLYDDLEQILSLPTDGCMRPVLKWYRDLNLFPVNGSPESLLSSLYKLTDALSGRDSAATLFVKTIKPRSAYDLMERVLHHDDMPYSSRAELVKLLRSINPELFSVNIEQIPQEVLAVIESGVHCDLQNPKLSSRAMSPEDAEIFQDVYPEPFNQLIPFHDRARSRLCSHYQLESLDSDVPIQSLIEAGPLLARLGIRIEFTDLVLNVTDDDLLVQLYPFLSMKNFWNKMDKWLSNVAYGKYGTQPLLRVSQIITKLLAIPEFVHELEFEAHSKIFERFVVFLQFHAYQTYLDVLSHDAYERKRFAEIMSHGHHRMSRYSAHDHSY